MRRRPPRSTLFPCTTHFRSVGAWSGQRTCAESAVGHRGSIRIRSEEHTPELQSRVDISYAVFCLRNKRVDHPESAQEQEHPARIPLPDRLVRRELEEEGHDQSGDLEQKLQFYDLDARPPVIPPFPPQMPELR